MPQTLSVVAALYRAAVLLYPPDFRREFASEMTRDFQQATSEAWHGGAWPGVLSVWGHLGADFMRTLMLQWFRSDWPAIALIPAVVSTAGFSLAAKVLVAQPPALLSVEQPERDQIVLLLLVTTVLLIVAATIILTLWFTRPLRYRTRM